MAWLLNAQIVDLVNCKTTGPGINALRFGQPYGSVARLVAPAPLHQAAIIESEFALECQPDPSPTV
jgi:hypothetical protein